MPHQIRKQLYTKENVKNGILHFLLGRGVAALAGLVTVIFLVRYLDIQSYAAFTALSGLIAFAGVISGLGIERAMTRYVPEARVQQSAHQLAQFIWRMTLIRFAIVVVTVGVIWLIWPLILSLFKDVTLQVFPIALAVFMIAESLFQHFSVIYQSLLQQKVLTQIMIIQWAGRLMILIAFVWGVHHLTLTNALWAMAIPELIAVLVFVGMTFHILSKLSQEIDCNEECLPSDKSEGWPNWLEVYETAKHNYQFQLLASPPQSYIVKMFVAALLPSQAVAAYGFFSSLAERFRQYIPLHLFYNLIEPVVIGQYLQWKDFKKLNERAQWLYKSNLIVIIPIIVCLLVAGSEFTNLLTNDKYGHFNWLLILVLIQLIVGSHVNLLQMVSNAVGESEALAKGGLQALFVMIVFWLISIPINPYFVFAGPLVYSWVCNWRVIHFLNKANFLYVINLKNFMPLCFASLTTYAVAMLVKTILMAEHINNIGLVVFSGCTVFIVFALLLWRLGAIAESEWSQVSSFLRKQ